MGLGPPPRPGRQHRVRLVGAGARDDLDHVEPLRRIIQRGGDPYDEANLMALCVSCHWRKTAGEVGLGGETL